MHRRLLCLAVASVLLSACQDQPVSQVSPGPVKIEIAGNSNTSQSDSFIGTLRARQRTDLSFEAAGRVQTMLVDIGDKVKAGQVLAQLDEAPARWRAVRAQADRDAAAATLAERHTWLQQQQTLARDNIISSTALQAAQVSHQQAQSQLAAAEAALSAARRDLSLTRITAPFDGEIVARLVQAHHDVTPVRQFCSWSPAKHWNWWRNCRSNWRRSYRTAVPEHRTAICSFRSGWSGFPAQRQWFTGAGSVCCQRCSGETAQR
jgi:multidrug efflux pump subunit AcrA (membrane-fusion protein)